MAPQDIEMSQREGSRYCAIYTSDGTMIGVVDFIPANFEGNPQHAFHSLLMMQLPIASAASGSRSSNGSRPRSKKMVK
jgi:hypothetical protein